VRLGGERTDGHVRLLVEDQGSGVPARERTRIFEPFQRGEGAVGSVVAGSGIGLSVVREIVRAHDGRVWVEEAPSGGARFVVELPAARAPGVRQRVEGTGATAAPAKEATAGVA